jgi:hypothetical protein
MADGLADAAAALESLESLDLAARTAALEAATAALDGALATTR